MHWTHHIVSSRVLLLEVSDTSLIEKIDQVKQFSSICILQCELYVVFRYDIAGTELTLGTMEAMYTVGKGRQQR